MERSTPKHHLPQPLNEAGMEMVFLSEEVVDVRVGVPAADESSVRKRREDFNKPT